MSFVLRTPWPSWDPSRGVVGPGWAYFDGRGWAWDVAAAEHYATRALAREARDRYLKKPLRYAEELEPGARKQDWSSEWEQRFPKFKIQVLEIR